MRWLILPLALAACAPSLEEGTWIGPVTPKTAGRTCAITRGVAQIRGDHVTFSPNEGTWILFGTAEPAGHVTAERIGTGINRQIYETRLDAQRTGTTLTGTYTTPACTFAVTLQRR